MAAEGKDAGPGGNGAADPLRRAYDVLGHVGGLILAVMAGAVFLQVVLRFFGSSAIGGLEEVPRYLFVWLIMIGAAAAMQRGEHTVLDYFVNLLAPRARAAVLAFTTAAGIGLFLYLIKLSFVLVPNAQLQSSAGLSLSLGWVFAAVPVGAALIVLPMFRKLFQSLRELWRKPS